MMPISLAGLVGAIIGTVVAGIVYHLLIERLERRLTRGELIGERNESMQSLVRRLVLAIDVAGLAALGYWLGNMFDD